MRMTTLASIMAKQAIQIFQEHDIDGVITFITALREQCCLDCGRIYTEEEIKSAWRICHCTNDE